MTKEQVAIALYGIPYRALEHYVRVKAAAKPRGAWRRMLTTVRKLAR